jgi:hypothetical protein
LDQSNPKNYLKSEEEYFDRIEEYWQQADGNYSEKMYSLSRFVPRQALGYFLARNEIFKQVLDVHGSILDFGIYRGGSFFTWLQLSAIYEPYNHIRKVIGFDSFEGFSAIGEQDKGKNDKDLALKVEGGMAWDGFDEISQGVELYDKNRPLGHVNKGLLVKGDLPGSVENFLDDHDETIVAMANFGLGLYEPTLKILQAIKPRLVKGSILVFEDLNQATWPGESRALFEVFDMSEHSLERLPYCPHISWIRI